MTCEQRGSKLPGGDTLSAYIRFAGGGTSYISASLAMPFVSRFAIYGTNGWVEVRDKAHVEAPEGWVVIKGNKGARIATEEIGPAEPVLDNLEAFARAVEGRRRLPDHRRAAYPQYFAARIDRPKRVVRARRSCSIGEKTMKALIFQEPNRPVVTDIAEPKLDQTEVLVRMRQVGNLSFRLRVALRPLHYPDQLSRNPRPRMDRRSGRGRQGRQGLQGRRPGRWRMRGETARSYPPLRFLDGWRVPRIFQGSPGMDPQAAGIHDRRDRLDDRAFHLRLLRHSQCRRNGCEPDGRRLGRRNDRTRVGRCRDRNARQSHRDRPDRRAPQRRR